MSTPVHVVGIGLDGAAGLPESTRQLVAQAKLLVGSDRHLSYFAAHPADRLVLGNLQQAIATIRQQLEAATATPIVVLTSGDPLFFGFGRLLLADLPAEQLTFHPSLSSVQLAFSRIKVPWQDAQLVSVHGRSLEELSPVLQQGVEKIAILTDAMNSPAAIAQLIDSLELPHTYQMWVCENLGGAEEQIHILPLPELSSREFAPLNVVILLRQAESEADVELTQLPQFGISDSLFHSFRDRPGLMTKREVRILALGELALQSDQVVWDIGAGTGSVAIEIGRLCPTSTIYAIEKTAAGVGLITKNAQRFGVANVVPVSGAAPTACVDLPDPNRIFIGGSGGNLTAILDLAATRLATSGLMVLAIATFEHLSQVMSWLDSQKTQGCLWEHRLLQVQLSRSVPVGPLTRLSPLNPVTLVTLTRS